MKYEDEKINNILADKPELAKSIKKFKVNYYNRGKSKKKKEEQDKDNNKMKKKHNKWLEVNHNIKFICEYVICLVN